MAYVSLMLVFYCMLLENECLNDIIDDSNNWLACAGMIDNLTHDFQECISLLSNLKSDTSPNPISFLVNTSEIMMSIQFKFKKCITMAKNVISTLLTVSDSSSN